MDVARAVQRIAQDARDLDDVRRRIDVMLRQVIGYDFAAFSTVDPATELWTSCYVSGLDASGSAERERTLYEVELAGDVNGFAELAARRIPAATLHAATDGRLSRARRWAPLLDQLDVTDELRAVLRVGGQTWGTLVLYRAGSATPFSPADISTLARALPGLAALFRLSMIRLALAGVRQAAAPPGAFTVLSDGSITGVSSMARAWLNALDDRGRVPAAVRAIAAAARAGVGPAIASIPSRSGGFATLYGSAIPGSDGVAVVIESAQPAMVSDVLAHAYGLTERERTVAAEATLGRSTREIARELGISPFTVGDHFKALYAKVGVSSRSELVATFTQHSFGRQRADATPASVARWYLDQNVG